MNWKDKLRDGEDECCEMARLMLMKLLNQFHEYVPSKKTNSIIHANCKDLKKALYDLLEMDLIPEFKKGIEKILQAWDICESKKRKEGYWSKGGNEWDW